MRPRTGQIQHTSPWHSGGIRARLVGGLLSLGFATEARADDGRAPQLQVEPVVHAEMGFGIVVDAEIVDPDGVMPPRILYRPVGTERYAAVEMVQGSEPTLFRGEIPGVAVQGPLEFFVEVFDRAGNGPARSADPAAPHRLEVEVPAAPEQHAPEILHQQLQRAPLGKSIPVEASFRGPSGVFNPTLFFRRVGSPQFVALTLVELPPSAAPVKAAPDLIVGTAGTGRFVAEIPSALTTGDLEYFIEAMDTQGNGPSSSGARERPHVIRVFDAAQLAAGPVNPDVALTKCLDLSLDGQQDGPCGRTPEEVPATSRDLYRDALRHLRLGSAPAALSQLEQVVKQSPRWAAAQLRLSQAAEAGQDWARAVSALELYRQLAGAEAPELPAVERRIERLNQNRVAAEAAERQRSSQVVARERLERQRAVEREAAEKETARRLLQEALLSSTTTWIGAAATFERWRGPDTPPSTVALLGLRARAKVPGVPMFVVGAQGWIGSSGTTDTAGAALAVSGLVGINLLALPAPSRAGFTLLSPFALYEPRYWVVGNPQRGHGNVSHLLSIGNHLQFGRFGVDLAVGTGIAGTPMDRRIEVSIGRRWPENE